QPKPGGASLALRDCSPALRPDQQRKLHMPVLEAERTVLSADHDKFRALLAKAQKLPPMPTAVVHPCDKVSLQAVVEAARLKLVDPILVGPQDRIRAVADENGFD